MALDIGFDTFGLLIKAGLRPGRKVMYRCQKKPAALALSPVTSTIAVASCVRRALPSKLLLGAERYEEKDFTIDTGALNRTVEQRISVCPPNLSLFRKAAYSVADSLPQIAIHPVKSQPAPDSDRPINHRAAKLK